MTAGSIGIAAKSAEKRVGTAGGIENARTGAKERVIKAACVITSCKDTAKCIEYTRVDYTRASSYHKVGSSDGRKHGIGTNAIYRIGIDAAIAHIEFEYGC